MTSKYVLLLGIVGAFAAGCMMAFFLSSQWTGNVIKGAILNTETTLSDMPVTGDATACGIHDDCADGFVCKFNTCTAADLSFCSQPFMMAESLEGRFIRYTLCANRCVVNGDTATCE